MVLRSTTLLTVIYMIYFLIQRCAVDDDNLSEASNSQPSVDLSIAKESEERNTSESKKPEDVIINKKAQTFSFSKHLSSKWTSGTGPRIGCVRDYPTELQFRALEQVNLSPRVVNGDFNFSSPIPSPRPSPNIRLSPRIAHMGLPSPRTPISVPN